MPSKNEAQQSIIQTQTGFSNSTYHHSFWAAANFASIALATSAGVVLVQSPIKTMLVSLSKNNVIIPAYQGGVWGCVRGLYTGTTVSLGSNSIRSAYVTGTKMKPLEGVKDEGCVEDVSVDTPSLGYIAAAAFGELLVTQIPSSLTVYTKAGLLPTNFKWHTPYNVVQLLKGNFVVKYANSGVSFYSLCVVEEKYADYLTAHGPVLSSNLVHVLSGALSGMTAAVWAYPFAAFIDYTQVRTEINNGRVVNKNPLSSCLDLAKLFIADPRMSLHTCLYNAMKQIPLRAVSTGATFSVVAGLGNFLGAEPLRAIIPSDWIPAVGRHPNAFFNSPVDTKQTSLEMASINLPRK